MLSTGFDIFAIREAIKAIRRFMTAPAWDGYLLEEFGSFAQARTNKEIEQFARNTAVTVDHVCCTVYMGKTGTAGGGTGALNSDLTVKATRGLRVVDASAFVSSITLRIELVLNHFLNVAFHYLWPYPDADLRSR